MTLVLLNGGSQERRMFWVPGIGGDSAPLRRVASFFSPHETSIYGLEVKKVEGQPAPFDNLREMASYYLSEIRQVQANGPYRLVGYSFGGSVAFEMACQLDDQGESVKSLIVIDHVPPPIRYQRIVWNARSIVDSLCNLARWVKTTVFDSSAELSIIAALGRVQRQGARVLRARLRSESSLDTDYVFSPRRIYGSLKHVMEVHTRALRSYHLRHYPGKLTLIRCTTMPLFRPYPNTLGWRTYVKHLQVVTIAGNHSSLLKGKLAGVLASKIAQVLATDLRPARFASKG